MKHLELEDYERKARDLRRRLDIDEQVQPDLITVLFKLKHYGLIKNYERVPDFLLPEDEAYWDPDERIIKLRESAFCGANQLNPSPRPRFTIAHELGHMSFKHTKLRHRNVSDRAINKIAPSIRADERQANGFAAAFLAPAHLVGNPFLISATELSVRFNLSIQNAEIRIEELERMYRREHKIVRPLPTSIIEFLRRGKNDDPGSGQS
ncbi:ImmA/IrrE family metallo-endopeptidase [Rhodoplanes sp. SY1]|uniref:ImmA/IrrE family metallo-endopeptidase n=1 Tax=Rhodoplanes sp. SY1 TaxID=3166646 RepID=UPI0038B62A3F